MVRLHTHQKDKPYKFHFVSLPEVNPVSTVDGPTDAEASPQVQEDEVKMEVDSSKQTPVSTSGAQDVSTASKLKQQASSTLSGIAPLLPPVPNNVGGVPQRLANRPAMMRNVLPGPYPTGVPRAHLIRTLQNVRAMNQPQQQNQQSQQNQMFMQQQGHPVQQSTMFQPSAMDLFRQQQLMRQRTALQMRHPQQQYQFRPTMRVVAPPQGATPMQLQQQLMSQQAGFQPLGPGQQQPPPPHQQGMMMRQQATGQFATPQQPTPGFMPPGRMY